MFVLTNIFKCFVVASIVCLAGCSLSKRTYHVQLDVASIKDEEDRQIAIFIDGTQNDQDSETNVSRLYHIVKNQQKNNLHIFYNEGVGTNNRFVGAITGLGIDKDVSEAYAFLAELYSPNSKVFIFGFSRGAYTSRVLAGMIYSVGIYDLSALDEGERFSVAHDFFDLYTAAANDGRCSKKEPGSASCEGDNAEDVVRIRAESANYVARWNDQHGADKQIGERNDGRIAMLGLWDTVEALGLTPTKRAVKRNVFGNKNTIEVINPNHRYIDQICNVDKVLHALALDDNREFVFTPISIKSEFVVRRCEGVDLSKVKEVWFSGAHADVGGGYTIFEQMSKQHPEYRDTRLAGVSLNWMLSEIQADPEVKSLLPLDKLNVPESPFAYSHDGQNGQRYYQRNPREGVLKKYSEEAYFSSDVAFPFEMHDSVFARIRNLSPGGEDDAEHGVFRENGYDSQWYMNSIFSDCITSSSVGYVLKKKEDGCESILQVKNP